MNKERSRGKTSVRQKKAIAAEHSQAAEKNKQIIDDGDNGKITPPSPGKRSNRPNKRKRIKKTLGPDFETYFVPSPAKVSRRNSDENSETVSSKREEKSQPSSRKSSPTTSSMDTGGVCDFCLNGAFNRDGVYEQLLFCKDCTAKAHPSCMDYTEDLARRAQRSPWQCIDCKICTVCQDPGDTVRNDSMLFCDACDKGYHMDCHEPSIRVKPTGKWFCTSCGEEDEKEAVEDKEVDGDANGNSQNGNQSVTESNSPSHCTPTESPMPTSPIQDCKPPMTMPTFSHFPRTNTSLLRILPEFRAYVNEPVPDASAWSVPDVVHFFSQAGFHDEAQVFGEQEIDGKSLLLLKRMDVLQELALPLGPALKIFAHIQRLQTNGQLIL